jgi:hypothetical protein
MGTSILADSEEFKLSSNGIVRGNKSPHTCQEQSKRVIMILWCCATGDIGIRNSAYISFTRNIGKCAAKVNAVRARFPKGIEGELNN